MSGRHAKIVRRAANRLRTDAEMEVVADFCRPRPSWCPRWTWRVVYGLVLLLAFRDAGARALALRLRSRS